MPVKVRCATTHVAQEIEHAAAEPLPSRPLRYNCDVVRANPGAGSRRPARSRQLEVLVGELLLITDDETRHESWAFEADVAKLLNLIVHSVYSDRDVFIRELISNAADACEKLRYEAIADPTLLDGDPALRIKIVIDADSNCLTVEDNGIGMSRDELIQALRTIAAFRDQGVHGPDRSRPGRRQGDVDRAVRRRLLFRLYGGRSVNVVCTPCRDR